MKQALCSLALSLTLATAAAAPTTWSFEGEGGVSGHLTVDLSLLGTELPAPGLNALLRTGGAGLGEINPLGPSNVLDVIVGHGLAANIGTALIQRDADGSGQFQIEGRSEDGDGSFSGIQLRVIGADLFPLDAGLDLAQPVDWLASGAEAFYLAFHYTGTKFDALYSGRIESMDVRTVPLPASIYLVLLALAAMPLTQRKFK